MHRRIFSLFGLVAGSGVERPFHLPHASVATAPAAPEEHNPGRRLTLDF